MGLISWIKGKYYDHRLDQADSKVAEGDLITAEEIYTSILGKQEYAVIHLANMLTVHADSVDKQIANLRQISELSAYATDFTRSDYQKELDSHLTKMERTAEERFNNKAFGSAVHLIHAVLTYRKSTQLNDKYHRYKAFEEFANSQKLSGYKPSLDSAISEFKQMSSLPLSDLQRVKDELNTSSRYNREIIFLSQFVGNADWINSCIIESIIKIISGKDAEIKNPQKISSICNFANLSKEASEKLAELANELAFKKDYAKAVSFDKYASEFLSDDNKFNNNRCMHIVEELSSRSDATEVKSLMSLAISLQLTDTQISSLKKRVCEIASNAEEVKSIKICQLFKFEKTFDKVYIQKAQKLCKQNKQSLLNASELLEIIQKNTNQDNYAEYLGRFVTHISQYDSEFYNACISKILREKSIDLLKTYWSIKPNKLFFEKLVNSSCPIYDKIVEYVIQNHSLFLADEGIKGVFCKCIEAFNNEEYTLSISETLFKNGCNINDYYVNCILSFANKADDTKAMSLYNRALSVVKNNNVIDAKKKLIRKFIEIKNFAEAENEAKSLTAIDNEAWTILAELYYKKASCTKKTSERVDLLHKVLQFDQSYELNKTFKDKKTATLSELSGIANDLFASGQLEEAYKICDYISTYQVEWLDLYLSLRNLDYKSVETLVQRIKHVESTFETIHDKADKDIVINSERYNELWKVLTALYVEKSESQPKDKAIDSLCQLRNRIASYCGQSIATQLTDSITSLVVKIKWAFGIELEHEQNFDKAITIYDSAATEKVSAYQKRAEFRSLICHIKANDINNNVEDSIVKALKEKSFQALREDIAYRYACYLIKSIQPGKAEEILMAYLPDEKSLLDICTNLYVKEAEVKLAEFNDKLSQMANGTMSTNSAMKFLKEIDSYKERISKHLPDTAARFSKYKVQTRAYILKCFFNEENYANAFKALKAMHPNFIENETAFRNLAVASLGIIESECSDDQTLRSAISLAVSAIYTDKLFIHSLEHTSWDDQFTFTLDESLGQSSKDDYEDMPENVNFDEAIDNQNISIKDVQKNLLLRIETAVREKHPTLDSFCQEEIESLNKILELNLDENFVIASPGLTSTMQNAKTSIREALDYDYNQGYGNQEDVLAVGLMYGFDDGNYNTYKVAKSLLAICKNALVGSQSNIAGSFTTSNISSIKAFDKLYSELKSACSSEMHKDVSAKLAYKQFLDKYEVVCKSIKDTTLSMTCANYVNGEIIHRLNDDSMKLRDGIGVMVRIYNLAPSNVQVKQNIEGILTGLTHEAEKTNSSLDRNALNKALRDLNGQFDSKIALSTIIAKVNNDRIEEYQALQQLYDLYLKQPSDEEVCDSLATLVKICIHKYIIGSSSYKIKSDVRNVLDKLKSNKSRVFKNKAKILALEYLKIMKELPESSRMLIMTGIDLMGNTLNEKGRALKSGLDYMKDLGDLDELIRKNR